MIWIMEVNIYIIEFAPEAASTSRFYRGWTCSRQLREHFIQKAILSCDPCHNKSYRVVLFCCQNSKFAFCQCGDSGAMSWMYLDAMVPRSMILLCAMKISDKHSRILALLLFGTWELIVFLQARRLYRSLS